MAAGHTGSPYMLSFIFACATCVQINLDQLEALAEPDTPWYVVSRAAGVVAAEVERLRQAGCPAENGCVSEDFERALALQVRLDAAATKAFYARPGEVDAHLARLDREGELLRKLSRCELGDAPKPPDLVAELKTISSELRRERARVNQAASLP